MEAQINRIVTDASPSPQYVAETKKAKKNKRKYWKRKNSKVPVEAQEGQDFYNVDDATPNSDNFESEDNYFDDYTENQDDQDIEKNNDEIYQTNEEEFNIRENITNKSNNLTNASMTDRAVEGPSNNNDSGEGNEQDVSIVYDGHMSSNPKVQCHYSVPKSDIPIQSEQSDKKLLDELEDVVHRTAKPIYNTKFLTKDADTYEVETFEKNIMVIFNHYEVIGYDNRYGTHKDVEKLKETFARFKFTDDNIIVYNDLNYKDIKAAMEEFSNADFTEFGCVVVVVLTHGKEGGYLMAKDRSYHENMLIDQFFNKGNQSLVTKPKVFIIQACRGSMVSHAMMVGKAADIQRDTAREPQIYTLPTEADLLLLHSTFAGDASHRETLNGSWFIQTLCERVVQLADTMDLESIMRLVKKDVAINKVHEVENRATGNIDMNKQIPVAMSTLTRLLYLTKPKQAIMNEQKEITPNITVVDGPDSSISEKGKVIQPKEHFIYMRNALRLYHPHKIETGQLGQSLLFIANSIDMNGSQEATMIATANAISQYLRDHAVKWDYYCMIPFLD